MTALASRWPLARWRWLRRAWGLALARDLALIGLGLWSSLAGSVLVPLVLLAALARWVPRAGELTWHWAREPLTEALTWEQARLSRLAGPIVIAPIPLSEKVIPSDSRFWRIVLYWALRPTLSAVQIVVVSVLLGLPISYVMAANATLLESVFLPDFPVSLLYLVFYLGVGSAFGWGVLWVVPAFVRALVSLEVYAARALLGDDTADLTARVMTLTTAREQVVDAADAERRRIERDLHDGAQQRLVAVAMLLGRAEARLEQPRDGSGGDGTLAGTDPYLRDLIRDAKAEARAAVGDLRNLTRGLHPPVLTDRGLDAALSAVAARGPLPVSIDVHLDPRPSTTIEAVLYFAVSEALTNAAKHAHASHASVRVTREGAWILGLVSDDGCGGARPEVGSGLRGLRDRLAGVDGTLQIDSPVGGPTVLRIQIPERPR